MLLSLVLMLSHAVYAMLYRLFLLVVLYDLFLCTQLMKTSVFWSVAVENFLIALLICLPLFIMKRHYSKGNLFLEEQGFLVGCYCCLSVETSFL